MSDINKVRNVLYTSAKVLGDVNAVEKGKVPQRIGRRIAGKYASRIMNSIFRG
jgi:hypothetical protein